MNNNYFPDDSIIKDLFTIKLFEEPSIVQFIHRNLAYFIILIFLCIVRIIYKNKDFFYLRNITLLISILLFFQFLLGVVTIIYEAHLILASMHQIGSILLITSCLILVYKNSKN